MSSKGVNSLAKVFDQKSMNTGKNGKISMESESHPASFNLIHNKIESLSDKMDKLIRIQEKVLHRLDGLSQDIDGIEKDVETLKVDKEEIHLQPPKQQDKINTNKMKEICQEMTSVMSTVSQRSEQQAVKLEGMERLVMSIQQIISFIGETVKNSRVTELLFKDPTAHKCRTASAKLRDHKFRDGKEKTRLNLKGLKFQKKKKPADTPEIAALRKQVELLDEVQELNRLNAERFSTVQPFKVQGTESAGKDEGTYEEEQPVDPALLNIMLDAPRSLETKHEEVSVAQKAENKQEVLIKHDDDDAQSKEFQDSIQVQQVQVEVEEQAKPEVHVTEAESPAFLVNVPSKETVILDSHEEKVQSSDEMETSVDKGCDVTSFNKSFEMVDDIKTDGSLESHVKESGDKVGNVKIDDLDKTEQMDEAKDEEEEGEEVHKDEDDDTDNEEKFFIDSSPPPPAPFSHRVVSAKPNQISSFYTINRQEVLGGGRFGQVHKCIENSSGLTLAAKIIKAKCQKEKELVKNEIQVMNQLDHATLIQLYAAYESRNDIILVLEYLDGGELFDRIIDENYKLTELDSVMFIRQICEGLQHMHKMYILHLDLKPENIMCVSRVTNKIKIIDFGLAKRYQPRDKLQVNFGTPEFLAPEVINYDFVSFPTDMWSLGVITYMLLSSLSPFLGDNETETLNNILACQWNFEEVEFTDISDEAKDFISKLLLVNKNWRLSASEALRHAWLSDAVLHHRLREKKNMCRSRRSSCVPLCDT